jgi:hypothetical protein
MVTLASHISVAVAGKNTGTAGQLIGVVCTTHVMVGGVLSDTEIICWQLVPLPQASITVQVRNIV